MEQDSPRIQPQFPYRVRVGVPMEEQAARANRFVSLVVGHTENDRQQSHNSKLRLWQLAVLRVSHLQALLHKAEAQTVLLEEELSDLQRDQQN